MGLLVARMKWDPATRQMVDWTPAPRPEINAPYVHQDSMKRCKHPVTGRPCESKSEFWRIAKAAGYSDRTGAEKVADNKPIYKEATPEHYERDVKIALEQLKSGTAPLTEADRAACKNIDQQLRNR